MTAPSSQPILVSKPSIQPVLLILVTEDWYLVSHRIDLVSAAANAGYRVIVATRVSKHADTIRTAGAELVPLEWQRRGNILADIWNVIVLIRLYRKLRPQVVHHVALKPIVFGAIAARLAKVPIIVNAVAGLGFAFTERGETRLRHPDRTIRLMARLTLGMALKHPNSRVIVQNRDDAEHLIRGQMASRESVVLIRGAGVNLNRFHVEPMPDGVPLIVLAARMLWDKGVGEFVKAAQILKRRNIAARFALVGDTDLANRSAISREQIADWVEGGAVEWWGHQPDLSKVFPLAHVACLPSYREGLPKVLLEAMACGRAVVTTDVPGCREVVVPGVNGCLVPVRSPQLLADALGQLLVDPEKCRRMGRESRALAEKHFGLEAVLAATLSLYQNTPVKNAAVS